MVSTQEQETLQLRALKPQTPIKGTFGLSALTLGVWQSCAFTAQKVARLHFTQIMPKLETLFFFQFDQFKVLSS